MSAMRRVVMTDKDGKQTTTVVDVLSETEGDHLTVGALVLWHARTCKVLKFDKGYPALVLIEDSGGVASYSSVEASSKKPTERWVRIDELETLH